MKVSEIINETTTAGGIATVVGGMAPTFTRNASIYSDDKPAKKKKKKKKYSNSVNESKESPALERDLSRVAEILHDYEAIRHYGVEVRLDKKPHGTYIVVDLGRYGVEDEELYDMLQGLRTSDRVWVKVVNEH
jgi:hypothetical protein